MWNVQHLFIRHEGDVGTLWPKPVLQSEPLQFASEAAGSRRNVMCLMYSLNYIAHCHNGHVRNVHDVSGLYR